MNTPYFKRALVLGLLSAMGPFAIDMYLPALPALGRSLQAEPAAVQRTLMAFFVTVGLGQLIYGPLSDRFGRKPPLLAGLTLFVLASVGCGLARSIGELTLWRAIAGIGACASIVTPRAVVRDLFTGTDAARMMSLLMLVFSVSPLLAPLAGSAAIAFASWRAVFHAVAGLGVLGLLLAGTCLEETRPPALRSRESLAGVFRTYGQLLADRRFVGLSAVGGFGMSAFFIYLANSSFVLIEHYALSPTVYSFFFSINAVAFIGTAQLTGRLTQRFGLAKVVRVAVSAHAAVMLGLALAWSLGASSLAALASALFIGYGFLGLVVPSTSVLAMDEHGAIAGTAAALFGTLQMMIGGAVIALIGLFADGTPWPMVAGIGLCAATTCGLGWWALAQPERSASVALPGA